MAKVLVFVCLLLVATLAKSKPILEDEDQDEEADNDLTDEERDDFEELEVANDPNDRNNDDYEGNDDYKDDAEDNDEDDESKNKSDDDDNDDQVDIVVGATGEQNDLDKDEGDEEEGEMSDDDVTDGVMEDSDGNMALERTNDDPHEIDDLENEEDVESEELDDMGKQITKLKKIFNEDIPQEIEVLKGNSKTLSDDLDILNTKLESFLRENGIKQDPAVPKAYEVFDYRYY